MNNISKRDLWRYVNKKIKGNIHHYHVISVISILFDEIIKDLKADKPIKITNFGTLVLKNLKQRKYYDINHREVRISNKRRILKFSLSRNIKNKLCKYLDIATTFGDSNNE